MTRPLPALRLRRGYPGLAGLTPEVTRAVTEAAVVKRLEAGSRVFEDGAPCMGFPLVLSGSIRVFKRSAEGRELPLYRVGPGESCILSTVCLLGSLSYDARAEAEEATEVAVLPPAAFGRLLETPGFREFVFRLFSKRLADLMALVDALAFKRLDQRLALLLADGPASRRATHQQIADELGTVREIASRLLKELEREGLVRLGRNRIEVLDAEGLEARGR